MKGQQVLTKAMLEAAMAEGITDRDELAEHFNVHPDSVRRAMRNHGLASQRNIFHWTPEIKAQVDAMNADGVPLVWIADTFPGMTDWILHHKGYRRGPEEVAAFKSAWLQIRKNPTLLALHYEFAPKNVRHPAAKRDTSVAA